MLPIALSAGPLTQPCADAVRERLMQRRYAVADYRSDGQGGRTLEADVRDGKFAAVLELSLTELASELVGEANGAGPNRLTAAALAGVPQLIVLGELDAIRSSRLAPVGDARTVEFGGELFRRSSLEECDRLGQEIANKASAARGPTAILVPTLGLSALDIADGAFWWPEADAALVQSLTNWISPRVQVSKIKLHINDEAFAAAVSDAFVKLMSR